MKTIETVYNEILQQQILKQGDRVPDILREWVVSILEYAADNAYQKDVGPEYADEPTWGIDKQSITAIIFQL